MIETVSRYVDDVIVSSWEKTMSSHFLPALVQPHICLLSASQHHD
jgi:hypothetical protein